MKDFIYLFQERRKEVDLYFEHLEDFWLRDAKIIFPNGSCKELDTDFKHILSANAFLILYNLVEACLSAAIEAIFLEVKEQVSSYDDIKPNIQKEIVEHIRKDVATDRFVDNVNHIIIDILNHHPTSREVFSGNIDREAIKDISRKYGFSIHTDARKTKNGEKLMIIKKQRNHLAHGFVSFKECGQEKSLQEMKDIKNESLLYIEQILNNIEQFLEYKKYLKS